MRALIVIGLLLNVACGSKTDAGDRARVADVPGPCILTACTPDRSRCYQKTIVSAGFIHIYPGYYIVEYSRGCNR